MKRLSIVLALLLALMWALPAGAGQVFDAVKARGSLNCGVHTGIAGFAAPDDKGRWFGFDVDMCRAIAAAVFGDADKVRFIPLTAQQRFTSLQSRESDVLSRLTTWTLSRDTDQAVDFPIVTFFDGQGFLVRKKLGVKSVNGLNGATICVTLGTTTELGISEYFKARNMTYKIVSFQQNQETVSAYDAERCDALSTDRSATAAYRTTLRNPDDHVVLPETISYEPLALAVPENDSLWADVVRWTVFALIEAETMGIDSKNIDEKRKTAAGAAGRLLGKEGTLGKGLKLADDWAYAAIKQVGNYGEIYERNVGKGSRIMLDRGKNDLVSRGGLLYSPPFR